VYVPVNVSGAGEGILEATILVSGSGSVVPHAVKSAGSSVHAVTFTPQLAEPHSAVVKFNSESVTGSSTFLPATTSDDVMPLTDVPELVQRVLFRARNLHNKNLAANRYDRHASFLYKFLCGVTPALRRYDGSKHACMFRLLTMQQCLQRTGYDGKSSSSSSSSSS